MASEEDGAIREFTIKEEGEEVAVVEVNVDVGEVVPAVNDVCRFCLRVLRINGVISNSALIFTRTKLQNKSLSDRFADLGLALKPSDNRSIRMCNRCTTVVERLERDTAILRKWKEDEEAKTANTDTPASLESTCAKRDRTSSPSKTPRALKKLRSSPPPSQQSRRSVTQVITTFPSKTVVKVPAEREAGIIQHITNQNWRTAANLLATHKDLFEELKYKVLTAINEQCQNLANPKNGSMLWKTSSDDLKIFTFHNLVLDLELMSPFLFSIFTTISNNNQDAACAALCIALRGREPRMSAFAYHINSIIARGGIKKAVFNRLSKMAITTSYSHALVKQKEAAGGKRAASIETQPEAEFSSELLLNSEAQMGNFADTEELRTGDIDSAPT